jgi:hypothetical protein
MEHPRDHLARGVLGGARVGALALERGAECGRHREHAFVALGGRRARAVRSALLPGLGPFDGGGVSGIACRSRGAASLEYGLAAHTQMSRTLFAYLGDGRWPKRRMAEALEW